MKELPILFSGPMVRAILEGRKTMTRRVVKNVSEVERLLSVWVADGVYRTRKMCGSEAGPFLNFPYGGPHDRLWVRETWAMDGALNASVVYRADGENQFHEAWKPSIHMRREYSRITLEVTGVRVERLQEITEADAVAEGLKPVIREKSFTVVCRGGNSFEVSSLYHKGVPAVGDVHPLGYITHVETIPEKIICTSRQAFQTLWKNINGCESWNTNPWVWVVEFRRVDK